MRDARIHQGNRQGAIHVETVAQVRQNLQMPGREVTETVEVSAAALTLNTENSTVAGEIENKPIIDLPQRYPVGRAGAWSSIRA